MNPFKAVIFDMDGVIVDNNHIHAQAWIEYAKKLGHDIDRGHYYKYISGRKNSQILQHLLGRELEREERIRHERAKEALYRELHSGSLEPMAGLLELLAELKERGIPLAVATSAPPENLDFVMDGLNLRDYFQKLFHEEHVTQHKPHPEIYLKAAGALGHAPEDCLIFEDSLPGIEAAKASGAYVVGLTTSHSKGELGHADKVVKDFTEIDIFRENG